MSNLYRSVLELPDSALDYLRWNLYYGAGDSIWYDDLSDENKAVVDSAEYVDEITDEVLFRCYDGISFCPEDFTSMAGDDWSAV